MMSFLFWNRNINTARFNKERVEELCKYTAKGCFFCTQACTYSIKMVTKK